MGSGWPGGDFLFRSLTTKAELVTTNLGLRCTYFLLNTLGGLYEARVGLY